MNDTGLRYLKVQPSRAMIEDGEGWDAAMSAIRPAVESLPPILAGIVSHVHYENGDVKGCLSRVASQVSEMFAIPHQHVKWTGGSVDLDMADWMAALPTCREDPRAVVVAMIDCDGDTGSAVILPANFDFAAPLEARGIRVAAP